MQTSWHKALRVTSVCQWNNQKESPINSSHVSINIFWWTVESTGRKVGWNTKFKFWHYKHLTWLISCLLITPMALKYIHDCFIQIWWTLPYINTWNKALFSTVWGSTGTFLNKTCCVVYWLENWYNLLYFLCCESSHITSRKNACFLPWVLWITQNLVRFWQTDLAWLGRRWRFTFPTPSWQVKHVHSISFSYCDLITPQSLGALKH